MANRDVVAIGASTGGFDALRFLAGEFPPDFPASVLVTLHLSSSFRSSLDSILTRAGPLAATFARDGESLTKGRIYIAPPERHLLVDGDRLSLGSGPRENFARPAIDPMLRSAAVCCGFRAIGLVLTGALHDGASGLWALETCGGVTVVQDPSDAACPDMPRAALSNVKPDHVTRLADIPALLKSLVERPAGEPRPVPDKIKLEVGIARSGRASMKEMDSLGKRSTFACPDCGGVMWEIEDAGTLRYRCHVGHAYTAELMSVALDESLRTALASALRGLDERIALAHRLEKEARETGHRLSAESWARKASEFEKEAETIASSIRQVDELAANFVKQGSRSKANTATDARER